MFFIPLALLLFSLSFSLEISSWKQEKLPDGTFKAEGGVEVYTEKYYIRAELMTYDPQRKTIYISGDIYIRSVDGKLEVRGSEAFLDLDRDVGYFINAEGRFEKFNFTAKRVDKEGENYSIEEGSITTCPPDKREMELCFFRASISRRYVFSQHNTLKFFKLPIAYLPVSFFPIGERRSGFLAPTIGTNTYNNFIYQQPVYWAISTDKDATLTLDFRDKQAKGLSFEYRQAINRPLDLTANLSFYKEPSLPGKWWIGRDLTTFRENRYRIKWDLDLKNLKAGVDLLSDPYFMEDVYLTTKERTVPYATSYLSYKLEQDYFLFSLDARRFYDTTSPKNRRTLQRLPEVGFYLKEVNLFGPLFFNLTTSYTNFYREEGLRAQRLLFFPEVSLPKKLFALNFLSKVTFENLSYFELKGGNYRDRSVFNSFKYVESLPLLFSLKGGGLETKNIFEISHTYRPKGYDNPRFDTFDQINKESVLRYTFRSNGYYRESNVYTFLAEGGYSNLGSFYYLGEEVRERLTPLRTLLSVQPLDWIKLYTDSNYDMNRGRFLKVVGNLTLSSAQNSITLGRVLEKNYRGFILNDQYSLATTAELRALRLGLSLVRDNRIDKDLQRQANIEYKSSCWSSGVLLRDLYDGNKQRYIKEVFLSFNVFDLQRFTLPLRR